jgi:hypothetical protein
LSGPGARRRIARVVAALAALFILATFAPPALFRPAPFVRLAVIHFQPLPLDKGAPGRRRLGQLRFLGGWRLTSDNPRFGGISAMHIDKGQVVAINDAGILITFPLRAAAGSVAGAIETLPNGPGTLRRKSDRDAESMTVHDGSAWIGFERINSVWRFDLRSWRTTAHSKVPLMRSWPKNSGAEGIVRLRDGRFLVFSEAAANGDDTSKVVLFDGDPALAATPARELRYRAPEGYRLTDAALLPDGRLLLLNRRFSPFSGFSVKLALAPPPPAKLARLIEAKEIASFQRPVLIDNLEALSVTRERGRTILWIASDDNFNPFQRTLLLKFALE